MDGTRKCSDCGVHGYHVETHHGETEDGRRIDPMETYLMVDPDGRLRCEECSKDRAQEIAL